MTANVIDLDGDESTRQQLRDKIAVMVGCRNKGVPLNKSTLNSVYAYLTGEFYFPPRVRHRPDEPEFEPRDDVFVAVAEAAGIADIDEGGDTNESGGDDDADSDDEDDADGEDDADDGWRTDEGNRPQEFRKDDLRTIAETINQTDDQRDWVRQ